jgi:hypothetical protein
VPKMGIVERDWPRMFLLTNQTLGAADPEYQANTIPEENRGTVNAKTRTAISHRTNRQLVEAVAHHHPGEGGGPPSGSASPGPAASVSARPMGSASPSLVTPTP